MTAWKRNEFGWLRSDGEVFLERGAPMSDTGHPAWLVWVRALDTEIDIEGSFAYTGNGDPARCLGELTGTESDVWFIHRGDEGWLGDAKLAAEVHLTHRDKKAQHV
jgi:hypothetical protein